MSSATHRMAKASPGACGMYANTTVSTPVGGSGTGAASSGTVKAAVLDPGQAVADDRPALGKEKKDNEQIAGEDEAEAEADDLQRRHLAAAHCAAGMQIGPQGQGRCWGRRRGARGRRGGVRGMGRGNLHPKRYRAACASVHHARSHCTVSICKMTRNMGMDGVCVGERAGAPAPPHPVCQCPPCAFARAVLAPPRTLRWWTALATHTPISTVQNVHSAMQANCTTALVRSTSAMASRRGAGACASGGGAYRVFYGSVRRRSTVAPRLSDLS